MSIKENEWISQIPTRPEGLKVVEVKGKDGKIFLAWFSRKYDLWVEYPTDCQIENGFVIAWREKRKADE